MSGLLTVCSKKMVMTINGNDHMMNLSMVVFTGAHQRKNWEASKLFAMMMTAQRATRAQASPTTAKYGRTTVMLPDRPR